MSNHTPEFWKQSRDGLAVVCQRQQPKGDLSAPYSGDQWNSYRRIDGMKNRPNETPTANTQAINSSSVMRFFIGFPPLEPNCRSDRRSDASDLLRKAFE